MKKSAERAQKESPGRRAFYKTADLVPHGRFPGSRTTLFDHIAKGFFPPPVKGPTGVNLWPIEVVERWIADLKVHTRSERKLIFPASNPTAEVQVKR